MKTRLLILFIIFNKSLEEANDSIATFYSEPVRLQNTPFNVKIIKEEQSWIEKNSFLITIITTFITTLIVQGIILIVTRRNNKTTIQSITLQIQTSKDIAEREMRLKHQIEVENEWLKDFIKNGELLIGVLYRIKDQENRIDVLTKNKFEIDSIDKFMSEIRINLHSLNFEFSNIYASISLMVSEEEESHILNKYLNSVGRSIYSLYNGKEINEFDKKVFMDIINRLRPEENADNITFGIHIAILRDLIKNIIKVKREAIRNVI